jgi:hypothetical protein
LCSLEVNWKCNCIFNIIIKKYIIFHCHTLLNYLRYWRIKATGWMVRGLNPSGGEIFRTCPDWPCGPPSLLYNGYCLSQGWSGRAVASTTQPHPVPRLKKE